VVVAAPRPQLEAEASRYLPLAVASNLEVAVAAAVRFQPLACHAAAAKGLDPDDPRTLSKTLTVD